MLDFADTPDGSLDDHTELLEFLATFSADPLGFVYAAYPWGEGELARYSGPQQWQIDILQEIKDGVLSVAMAIAKALAHNDSIEALPILFATTSGHGIGKSALVSWILDWAQSTFEDTKGVVTANTENQLKTKTWAELAKWHRLSLSKPLFKMTATARYSIDKDHAQTWRIDMVPWSEKNTEAFAGLHNYGKRIIIVFDEGSAIPDIIYEVTEGALSDKDTQILWFLFGNPTKNSGRFREAFAGGKFAHRWNSRAIDSRDVDITNKAQIESWLHDYGEDHDFFRVRVRGVFPRIDAVSYIELETVREATRRPYEGQGDGLRFVIGVDCARGGTDQSVITFRRGLDGRSKMPRVYSGINTVQLVRHVYDAWQETDASAVFVDVGSFGAGVFDQLEQLGVPVYAVDFGSGANAGPEEDKCLNLRAMMYFRLRKWLRLGGLIPAEVPQLKPDFGVEEQFTASTYTYARADSVLQIESKKDMRRRGVESPDLVDSYATTFAFPFLAEALPAAFGHAAPSSYQDVNPFS